MGYPLLSLQLHLQLSQNYAVPQVWLQSLLIVRPTPEPNQPLMGLQPLLGADAAGLSLSSKEMQAGQGLLSMLILSSAGIGQSGRSSQVEGCCRALPWDAGLAVANPVRAEMPPVSSSHGPLSC